MYVLLQLSWYLENSVKLALAYLICASSFFFFHFYFKIHCLISKFSNVFIQCGI